MQPPEYLKLSLPDPWFAAQAYQKVVTGAVLLSTLVNLGTLLSVSACGAAATASFAGAGVSAVLLLFNWLKARPHAPRKAPPHRLPCQVFGAPMGSWAGGARWACSCAALLTAVRIGGASCLTLP